MWLGNSLPSLEKRKKRNSLISKAKGNIKCIQYESKDIVLTFIHQGSLILAAYVKFKGSSLGSLSVPLFKTQMSEFLLLKCLDSRMFGSGFFFLFLALENPKNDFLTKIRLANKGIKIRKFLHDLRQDLDFFFFFSLSFSKQI